jgi:predicted nucleotidyltransferase
MLESKSQRVDAFLTEFTAWAKQQADILAVGVVGSYARDTARDDSDVDLVVVVQDPKRYLNERAWVKQFGEVASEGIEDYGLLISLRVFYANGREVEYGLTDERWVAQPLDAGTREVIKGGLRVLFERGDLMSRHLQ